LTTLYSTKDNQDLNGPGKEVTIDVFPTVSRVFRLDKQGRNWAGTNFVRVKNIELFSDDPDFAGGVFKTLVAQAKGDPHHADVVVSASNFDFQRVHELSPSRSICTLFDQDQPCLQFEIVNGRVIIQGYRMQQLSGFGFEKWSVQGSNDGAEWIVLDRRDSSDDMLVKMYRCDTHLAVKFVRLVSEEESDGDDVKLRLRHFDVFGIYLDVP
jgi:hypothetical protein